MAVNFPGPYEVRIFYDTQLTYGRHVLRMSCNLESDPDPAEDFANIAVLNWDLSALSLQAATDAFVTLVKPLLGVGTDIYLYELWKYQAGTFDADFVSAGTSSAAGALGGTAQAAAQTIITFRTAGGSIMKVNIMESNNAPGPDQSFPTGSATLNSLAAYLVGQSHPWVARDGTRPIAAKGYFPGQNEALWKKYNRGG